MPEIVFAKGFVLRENASRNLFGERKLMSVEAVLESCRGKAAPSVEEGQSRFTSRQQQGPPPEARQAEDVVARTVARNTLKTRTSPAPNDRCVMSAVSVALCDPCRCVAQAVPDE